MKHFTLVLLVCASASRAVEPQMNWMPAGIALGYYRPVKLDLSETVPAALRKAPADLKAPRYGTMTIGPKESPTNILIVLDEPTGEPARLWVDANANGDLNDDAALNWTARSNSGKTSYFGKFDTQIDYGGEMRTLGFSAYRFDPNEKFRESIFYYRDYGWSGTVTLGGKTLKAMLVDDSSSGDFRPQEGSPRGTASLLLDLDANGSFDTRNERFNVREPFAIEGATYEVTGLTATGAGFSIVPSTKKVAEKPVPPVLTRGSKALSFEATTMDGKKVRFPEDYKGRLVMLDFWATWCGPCRAEVPNLVKVYGELAARGFDVLGITLDNADGKAAVEKYTAEQKMDWPQIFDGKGWQADLAQRYGIRAIPTCLLVDGSTGTILATSSELRGAALKPTVERHLNPSAKPAAAGTAPTLKPGMMVKVFPTPLRTIVLPNPKAPGIPSRNRPQIPMPPQATMKGQDYFRALTLTRDGGILAAGSAYGGTKDRGLLVAFRPDGGEPFEAQISLADEEDDRFAAVGVQADGQIVAAGVSHLRSRSFFAMAIFSADGFVKSKSAIEFGAYRDAVRCLAIQSDDRILLAGSTSMNPAGDNNDFALARFDAEGRADTTFGSEGKATVNFDDGDDVVNCIALQQDGRIVVAGGATMDGQSVLALVRFSADGKRDFTFGKRGKVTTMIPDRKTTITCIAIQSDQKIVVAGTGYAAGSGDGLLLRYLPDGQLDESFGTGGRIVEIVGSSTDFNALTIQQDGKIVVAGAARGSGHYGVCLLRYLPSGRVDTSFGNGGRCWEPSVSGDAFATAIVGEKERTLLVGGYEIEPAGTRPILIRYSAN